MAQGVLAPGAQLVLDHPADVVEMPFDLLAETRRRLSTLTAG